MAKDEYYVIVAKILVFLYKRLKGKETGAVQDYIAPMSADFPIQEDYLLYVVEKLSERGYVERVQFLRAWGGDIVGMDVSRMRITPEGIDYLKTNSIVSKAAQALKEAVSIAGLFC